MDMVLQSIFIADITGMDDKCDILVSRIIPDVIRPVFLVFRIEYLGIGNMEKRFLKMFTVRFIIPSTSEMSTTSLHQWQEEIISPAIQKKTYTAG